MLRAKMLHQLQAMTSNEHIARSDEICACGFDSPAGQKAQSAVLSPLRTAPQIEALEAGAVVTGESTFIIPQTMRVEAQLNLPFSGYAAHAFKLGICFAFQHTETIPIEPHDAIMNAVICA
jgi:5-formyltetrahydrofolate cyclo-ligase